MADIVSGSKVPMEISSRFALNARAPAAARHWLDQLASVLPSGRLDDLRLVVSELVTNSVIHSDSPGPDRVDVKVQVLPDRVHVEVVEPATGEDASELIEPVPCRAWCSSVQGEPGGDLHGDLRSGDYVGHPTLFSSPSGGLDPPPAEKRSAVATPTATG